MVKKIKKDLAFELRVSKTDHIWNIKDSIERINESGRDKYMASGLIVTITDLSGRLVTEFKLSDGLSRDVQKALITELETRLKYLKNL